MKIILYSLLSLVFLASCESFLQEDAKGVLTPENFFNNSGELEGAITGLYRTAISNYLDGNFSSNLMGSDDLGTKFSPFQEMDVFVSNSESFYPGVFWADTYKTIFQCNNIILHYEKTPVSDEVKQLAAGQAYFFRAWSYFALVRIFNEIPLMEDVTVNYDMVKSGPADIYKLIVDDLKKAEEWLPASWNDGKELVKVTQGSAKALLAEVYLAMAGYPLMETANYALAAAKAKEIIDSGRYKLETYEKLWSKDFSNDEVIFGLVFMNINKGSQLETCYLPNEYQGWGILYSERKFFYDFPEGPRKNVTFETQFRTPGGPVNWTESKYFKNPFYRKMMASTQIDILDPNSQPWNHSFWQFDKLFMYIRYAHVLLTYAEAKAMSSGVDGSAYDAVNEIRGRAGLPDLPSGLSVTAFRDAVFDERGWEFAGEFTRWFDLVRLERVEQIAANRDPNDNAIPALPTKKNYFQEIPANEVRLNPNLNQ
ncbi:MAG: RagB/SusD family nutrient uptake outer membrane protein [Mangrovibacterium sp.]